jgi:tight adherence protein B
MGIELLAAVVAGLAIALFTLYFARRNRTRPEVSRLRALADKPRPVFRGISWDDLRRRGPSSLPLLRTALRDSQWAARIQTEIDQAGLKLRVGEYLLGRFLLSGVTFFTVWLVGRNVVAFVLGLGLAVVGFWLPAVWLSWLRRRRIQRIAKQLPEAVGMMANGLRAGFAFQHGIDMVAKQMEAPISEEFARVMVDLNVGSTVEEALHGLLDRADSEDMNLVVTAVLVQRTSGGNLSEILETVGETMRERERLVGEIRTMTSQQRFSGTVLTFWPLAILGLFSLFNWDQTSLLFTTQIGLVLITLAAIGQVLGYYTIRRILDIDI